MRERPGKAESAVRKPNGRARPRQQQGGKRASYPWINSQIIAASEAGGLPHLMATIMAHLPQMNLVNLSTAVHRVAKLSSNDGDAQAHIRHNPAFNELLQTIATALSMIDASEAQPQSLSNVAWSLATMRLMHRPLIQVVSALAVTNISSFKPFELSTMLWAFAKLTTIDNATVCMKPVFQASASHIMNHIAEFGFRCLATTAWAFATARQRHARLFRSIGAYMVPMAHVANCQEIANTSWAFGTADFHDDVLFTELAEKAMPRLDEFKPQELSNMLWGFGTNGFFHEAFFTLASVVTQHMELQAQHLANILWAFVRVRPRHPVTHTTILALLPSCTRQLESFKPQEVSSTALAVAKAYGIGDDPDQPTPLPPTLFNAHLANVVLPGEVRDFFNRAMPWAVPRLHEFSAQSLANTVSAFAMVRTPGDTALLSAVGHEVVRRFHHLEPTALLHLLKGFSGAPKDPCDHVSKMLASAVAQHIDNFRPQELQTLSRICVHISGSRRVRDFTTDELRSCCLSYALGTEAQQMQAQTAAVLEELAPPHLVSRIQLDGLGALENQDFNFDDTDYTMPQRGQVRNNRGSNYRHNGVSDYRPALWRPGGLVDPNLDLADLISLDDELDHPGMPPGALFEADFAPSGPPKVNHHANGLLRLSDSLSPAMTHIPTHPYEASSDYNNGYSRPGAIPSFQGHPAQMGRQHPQDRNQYYGNSHVRNDSPDNIGLRPWAENQGTGRGRVDNKASQRAIRNQRVPTNAAWIASSQDALGSINEICRSAPSEQNAHQAALNRATLEQFNTGVIPYLTHELDAEGGNPKNPQWRCSIKNSFLHFHGQGQGGVPEQQEQMEDEEPHYHDNDGGSSQRSSSVPSRFESVHDFEDNWAGYQHNGTPRHQPQAPQQENWPPSSSEDFVARVDGQEFLWAPKPLQDKEDSDPLLCPLSI